MKINFQDSIIITGEKTILCYYYNDNEFFIINDLNKSYFYKRVYLTSAKCSECPIHEDFNIGNFCCNIIPNSHFGGTYVLDGKYFPCRNINGSFTKLDRIESLYSRLLMKLWLK